jgi:hypothetical protein
VALRHNWRALGYVSVINGPVVDTEQPLCDIMQERGRLKCGSRSTWRESASMCEVTDKRACALRTRPPAPPLSSRAAHTQRTAAVVSILISRPNVMQLRVVT